MRHGYWPTYRGGESKLSTTSRPQQRRESSSLALNNLRQEFGTWSATGNFYWPVNMRRRTARAIARERARRSTGRQQ